MYEIGKILQGKLFGPGSRIDPGGFDICACQVPLEGIAKRLDIPLSLAGRWSEGCQLAVAVWVFQNVN